MPAGEADTGSMAIPIVKAPIKARIAIFDLDNMAHPFRSGLVMYL